MHVVVFDNVNVGRRYDRVRGSEQEEREEETELVLRPAGSEEQEEEWYGGFSL